VIRLVLFDIDGTLVRTGGAGVKAFERTFASEFNLPKATREISFAGRTDTSLVRQCLAKHGIDPSPENSRKFFDSYVFWLDHLLRELPGQACPGVHECIQQFQALETPPALGLLTGNIRLGAELKLRRYGLWDFFKTGAFGDDHENRNELAAIAKTRGGGLAGRSLKGSEILVIGDTPLDVECANAIQARVLAVGTGGFTCAQLQACKPHWVAEDLTGVDVAALCGR
jgi:phosphoglycolate phosphatase